VGLQVPSMDGVYVREAGWGGAIKHALLRGPSKENLKYSGKAIIYSSRRSVASSISSDQSNVSTEVEATPRQSDLLHESLPSSSQQPLHSRHPWEPPEPSHEQKLLPSRNWEQPEEREYVRGGEYMEDRVKERSGEPLLTLCACQLVDLQEATHCAGATAALLASGALTVPPSTRFVFSLYFMNPAPPKSASASATPRPHALLCHFASDTCPSDAEGPGASLLRELWSGDATRALSRFKMISRLHSGPSLLRAAMTMSRMDVTRPMLVAPRCNSSLTRTTVTLPAAYGASAARREVQHVEMALDVASNYYGSVVYRAAFSAVTSIDVSLTFVLEGRGEAELPEAALCSVTLRNLDPADAAVPHASWPTLGQGKIDGEAPPCSLPGVCTHVTPKEAAAEVKRSLAR